MSEGFIDPAGTAVATPTSIYMAILRHGDRRGVLVFGPSDRRRNKLRLGSRGVPHPDRRTVPSWLRTLLAIPLELKILGANLIIMLVAVVMLFGPIRLEPTRLTDALVVVASLVVGSMVSFVMVRVALRPVASLTHVAWLVSQGLLGARVPPSIMADRELKHLAATINQLLDDLVAVQASMPKLDAMPVSGILR
jgi:HAMP domain-containing protein